MWVFRLLSAALITCGMAWLNPPQAAGVWHTMMNRYAAALTLQKLLYPRRGSWGRPENTVWGTRAACFTMSK